jgi:hypothetical protein
MLAEEGTSLRKQGYSRYYNLVRLRMLVLNNYQNEQKQPKGYF